MRTLEQIVAQQGWTLEMQVMVLLRYIENQNNNGAFVDFLKQQAGEENAGDGLRDYVVTYVQPKDGPEEQVFKCYADGVEDAEEQLMDAEPGAELVKIELKES
jgi:hypothetical protein